MYLFIFLFFLLVTPYVHSIKEALIGYFDKYRHDAQYGLLTCAYVVGGYQLVISEESGHQGEVIRSILKGPRNIDGTFVVFDWDNKSFHFIDHSVLTLPIIKFAGIQMISSTNTIVIHPGVVL